LPAYFGERSTSIILKSNNENHVYEQKGWKLETIKNSDILPGAKVNHGK